MKPRIQVAVVIVSYNTRELLLESLGSVIESTRGADLETIVVDNASVDGSFEAVRGAYPQVNAIRNPINRGFGAACNQAINATSSPLILLLNSDARLTQQAFEALCDCMGLHQRCGAAGCALVTPDGEPMINTRNFLTPYNQALEQLGVTNRFNSRGLRRTHRPRLDENLHDCSVDWIDGACLMLRREALDEVGLFDEQFFMYSEDEDLCYRLRERAWAVCFTGAGTVIHHGGASAATMRLDMLRHFYASQMLFLAKHRGRKSTLIYTLAMKSALMMKRLWLQFAPHSERRRIVLEQIAALNRARSTI